MHTLHPINGWEILSQKRIEGGGCFVLINQYFRLREVRLKVSFTWSEHKAQVCIHRICLYVRWLATATVGNQQSVLISTLVKLMHVLLAKSRQSSVRMNKDCNYKKHQNKALRQNNLFYPLLQLASQQAKVGIKFVHQADLSQLLVLMHFIVAVPIYAEISSFSYTCIHCKLIKLHILISFNYSDIAWFKKNSGNSFHNYNTYPLIFKSLLMYGGMMYC